MSNDDNRSGRFAHVECSEVWGYVVWGAMALVIAISEITAAVDHKVPWPTISGMTGHLEYRSPGGAGGEHLLEDAAVCPACGAAHAPGQGARGARPQGSRGSAAFLVVERVSRLNGVDAPLLAPAPAGGLGAGMGDAEATARIAGGQEPYECPGNGLSLGLPHVLAE